MCSCATAALDAGALAVLVCFAHDPRPCAVSGTCIHTQKKNISSDPICRCFGQFCGSLRDEVAPNIHALRHPQTVLFQCSILILYLSSFLRIFKSILSLFISTSLCIFRVLRSKHVCLSSNRCLVGWFAQVAHPEEFAELLNAWLQFYGNQCSLAGYAKLKKQPPSSSNRNKSTTRSGR